MTKNKTKKKKVADVKYPAAAYRNRSPDLLYSFFHTLCSVAAGSNMILKSDFPSCCFIHLLY